MKCYKCSGETVESTALGKSFNYCRNCKIEVKEITPNEAYQILFEFPNGDPVLWHSPQETVTSCGLKEAEPWPFPFRSIVRHAPTGNMGRVVAYQKLLSNTCPHQGRRSGMGTEAVVSAHVDIGYGNFVCPAELELISKGEIVK